MQFQLQNVTSHHIANSSCCSRGASAKANDASHAITSVTKLPISTYQVQASGVQNLMYSITTMLTNIPINAGGSLTFRKNVPTKNTPNTGPLISEAIDKA